MAYNAESGTRYARLKREAAKIKGMNWSRQAKRWCCKYPDGSSAAYIDRDHAAASMLLGHKTPLAEGKNNVRKITKMDDDYCPISETHLRRSWSAA